MKNVKKYSDDKLISRVALNKEPGKSEAFSELYNRYSSKIYIYLKKIFNNESVADDIFQETFIKFLKKIEEGCSIDNVAGYLLRTARNLSMNYKRDFSGNDIVAINDKDFIYEDKTLENIELSEVIDSLLNMLPDKHKEAFILQTYYGMSYNEIAELTDVPITTVRNRIVRAKSKLRELIAPVIEEKN